MSLNPETIGTRLRACIKDGRLSIADLQIWFDKSRTAVSDWAIKDRIPRGAYCEEVLRRLKLLEMLIRKKKGPLVPYRIGSQDRPEYIRRMYDDNNNTKIYKRDLAE